MQLIDTQPNHTPQLGRQLGLLGAERAASRADRDSDGQWSAQAWDFMVAWARQRQGQPFQGEDVRHAAAGVVPAPPEPRAWGSILVRAAKARLIARVGYAPAKDPKSHGNPKSVWVWVG